MRFDGESLFNWSQGQKQKAYQSQANSGNASIFVILGSSNRLYSVFSLTGLHLIHRKYKNNRHCSVPRFCCADKFPWSKLNYFFLDQLHYSSPLLLPTEACFSLGCLNFRLNQLQYIIFRQNLLRKLWVLYTVQTALSWSFYHPYEILQNNNKLKEISAKQVYLCTVTWCTHK